MNTTPHAHTDTPTPPTPAELGRHWAERSASLRAPTRRDAVWAIARLTDGPRVVVPDDALGHDPDACLHIAGRCVQVSDTDALAFCRAAAEVLRPRLDAFLGRQIPLQEWEQALVDLQQVVALDEGAPFCTLCGDAVAVDTARGLCGPCAYDLWRDQEGR
jgi:ribosomal protein S27AE